MFLAELSNSVTTVTFCPVLSQVRIANISHVFLPTV